MTRTFIRLAVTTALLLAAVPLIAQQQKIGYVNSETILKELPEAKDAQGKLEAMVKNWQDQLDQMSNALKAKYDDYQKKQALLNDAAKQEQQQKLIDEEQKMNQFRQDKFGQQGELALQRDKLMTPIRDRVMKVIEQVAKEQKVAFMFDKAGDVLLLYADKTADYTYIVLDRLKRGSK